MYIYSYDLLKALSVHLDLNVPTAYRVNALSSKRSLVYFLLKGVLGPISFL